MIFAKHALLAAGWAENVRIEVSQGAISRIETAAHRIGLLYGLNTVGAGMGALSAALAGAASSATSASNPSPILSEDRNIRSRNFLKKDISPLSACGLAFT